MVTDEIHQLRQLLQVDPTAFRLWDVDRTAAEGIVAHQSIPQFPTSQPGGVA